LRLKKVRLEQALAEVTAQRRRCAQAFEALRQKIDTEKDASREAERELFQAMAKRSELEKPAQ